MQKIVLTLLVITLALSGEENTRSKTLEMKPANAPAFMAGEYLKYNLDYGFISAGYAEVKVNPVKLKNGKAVFHISGFGRTTGVTEWAFKTRDYYDSYISANTYNPVEFIRNVDEGGYLINRHIVFNHDKNQAVDLKLNSDTTFSILENTQDMLSAYYYLRNTDLSSLKKGDKVVINVFMDHEDYPFTLKYLGKEVVKVEGRKIRCLKFVPGVQQGRVFDDKDDITIWLSDDENKVLVLIKSKIAVGSVKVKLAEFKNLRHPLSIVD